VSNVGKLAARSSRVAVTDEARRDTESLERSRAFQWLVRAGFVARAVTYGVIGALALSIALGAGTAGTAPNQQGALLLIARSPLGLAALVVICAGLLAYALWKLTLGIWGRGPEGGGGPELKDRVANLAGGVAYLGFFAVAVGAASGSSGNSSGEPRHAAAGVLGWPGGQVLVGIAGAALIGISAYQFYDAVRGTFAQDSKLQQMGPKERRLFMGLGHLGLSARALVFALVGYFLLRTAIDFNPGSAVGVDGALARLHHEPLGPWLLGLVAVGLLTFAAFSLIEARYRRL
jgi:Domain of Unknown Function (DUF1206)